MFTRVNFNQLVHVAFFKASEGDLSAYQERLDKYLNAYKKDGVVVVC